MLLLLGMLLLLVLLHLLFEKIHPLCEALHRIFDLIDLLGGCSSRSCELSLDFVSEVCDILGQGRMELLGILAMLVQSLERLGHLIAIVCEVVFHGIETLHELGQHLPVGARDWGVGTISC